MTIDHRRLELDKILSFVANYAVTEKGKERVNASEPATELGAAQTRLTLTEEAYVLLFEIGAGSVCYFPPLSDKAERAAKGASLACSELTEVGSLLTSARLLYTAVINADGRIVKMKELVSPIVARESLEREIADKIIGENEIADGASERLFAIRREKRLAGERIRARLSEYLTGSERKYLQEGIVTVRGDRFVVPVKAEYKRSIKGFVHDRSATGATFFIEPEEIFEMNNELLSLALDEKEEEARILKELSAKIGGIATEIEADAETVTEADAIFARAEYAHEIRGIKPALNQRGVLNIVKGRHPLLDKKQAVPVSVGVGEKSRFLVLSGSNTGGKTVTLKMCGLFPLMAACGLFVPAQEGTLLSVFSGVECDAGDSQSIEENLSTFSSHIVNVKEILKNADSRSLVLIDEPGGGTDPEEGQALAVAVLSALVKRGCVGIVTTHYGALKEFAYEKEGLENGSMEFDAASFRPLFRLKMGVPGSSNALAICKRLGVDEEIIEEARRFLSKGAKNYEKILRNAEESRIRAEELERDVRAIKEEWSEKLASLEKEEEKFRRERERFLLSSKAEARRIVTERTAEAEELLAEMEEIFKKKELSQSDLIKARTLKNRMDRSAVESEELPVRLVPVDWKALKEGDTVTVGSMDAEGVVRFMKRDRREAEVQCGSILVKVKADDLFAPRSKAQKKEEKVRVVKHLNDRPMPVRELNVIGSTVLEAQTEVENFLDSAIVANLEEVRIVHGMGTGKLRKAIHELLRAHRRVKEFRLGVYGEGESGVTIVKLK